MTDTKLSFSIVVMVDVGGMAFQRPYVEHGQSELVVLVDAFVRHSASALHAEPLKARHLPRPCELSAAGPCGVNDHLRQL